MLKTILSISGKPGLYKLVSNGKNMIIVESLTENKKLPVHTRDKVVSLGDISIYTDEGETPLREVFTSIKEKENGAKKTLAAGVKPEELKNYLAEILPTFDRERVYPTDIKKMINWYNILIDAGVSFEEVVAEENTEDADVSEKVETKPKSEKKAAPKKSAAPKMDTKSKAAKPAAPRKAN